MLDFAVVFVLILNFLFLEKLFSLYRELHRREKQEKERLRRMQEHGSLKGGERDG